MKMRTSWKKDKRAEMGVGTMIIFIAMVLVAAVAASVLISTANKVREQAQNTGDQAINNVASGFVVQDVTGTVNTGFSQMTDLTIQIRLQAGSPSLNMDLVSIQFVSGTTNQMLSFVAGSAAAAGGAVAGTSYSANSTSSAAWGTGNHVVQQGDMITVTITGLTLSYSAAATVKIVPAYGSSTLVSFVTPSYYNTEYVNLK
jgi:archaeal flagellin FlaB